MSNGTKLEVSLAQPPLTVEVGAKDAAGKQKDATLDSAPHKLTALFPGFDESKLGTWEGFAKEILRVGAQFDALSKGASVILKTKNGEKPKPSQAVSDHACKDEASFFMTDLIDGPEAMYNLLIQGMRQAASTKLRNRIKSVWGPQSEGATRGGPKSVSVDEL